MVRSEATKTWMIRTVAGNGDGAWTGDGGSAASAALNEPKAVMQDSAGNLFIADSENHVVRRVDRNSGVVVTIAGRTSAPRLQATHTPQDINHESGVSDPFDDSSITGERAFTQQTDLSGTVRYIINGSGPGMRFGGDGGPADRALMNFPSALAIDADGHLYVADTMNHRIRRIDAKTGTISTLAGIGQPRFGGDGGPAADAGLNEPAALAIDRTMLYVADQSNNRIRAIDLGTGTISTIAGTGAAAYNGDDLPGIEATLAGPSGLALGSNGTLFIADTFNGRVRALDLAGHRIRTVAGDGGAYRYQNSDEPPSSSLSRPSGIAVDIHGNLYITDSDNHLVRRWDRLTGRLERLAGVGAAGYGGDGACALEAALNYPFGIAMGLNGAVLIADTFNHRIREMTQ
ncbi:hypothetical protein W02_32670 [Nitrospira sp. KM1]|uniref:hypothetical protein n=1 Tax=Nitrospira sp. KM1 TaxID=1936990 RepID=UPI0013A79CBA|nr:hypothetical protein [Nitrospira sp. KM1]BCA56127.1 hypothetical protein W02_32670 [Nitrospira sp. KM1]